MVTIKDVAARAGVSYTTVSHVLNETRPVRSSTRDRVLAAAHDLHYKPSAVARSLKHQATRSVGVLLPNAFSPYFAELARGIEDACFRAGWTSVLCSSDHVSERQAAYLELLHQKRVDGIVLASPMLEASWLQALDGATCPLVVSGHEVPGLEADVVQIDNERGGAMAAAHLLRLGHKRFGCITGNPELDPSRDRLQGFRDAIQEAGATLEEGAVVASDFTTAGGYRVGLELLRSGVKFTALFVQSDMMAIGVLRAAGELGISVPGQLSVVGFDDIELSRFLFPALTTIGMPLRQVGEATAQALFERISRPDETPRRVRLRPTLRARESTAPPLAF
jgi:LacI family transcriptional regulator, galactose operon repressor